MTTGLALTGILQGWYGALLGNYWLNSLAMMTAIAAITGTITGLAALLGPVGIGIGAVLILLVANPISAAALPVEFIVSPWGTVGQWMPPGAAGTLIRKLSYFPDASTTFQWLCLTAWATAGIALTFITRERKSVDLETY